MDVTPRISADSKVIQSYKNSQFKVSGDVYQGGVLVFPDDVRPWTTHKNVADLDLSDLQVIIDAKADFEVLLLGTGNDFAFLPPELSAYLKQQGISAECMNTGAACRTFNVLLSEGRKVCAAMLPI